MDCQAGSGRKGWNASFTTSLARPHWRSCSSPRPLPACADAQDLSRAGFVNAVENEAEIVSATGTVKAVIGAVVQMKDELRTGPNARLQVTFRDNTVLTLGENATVVVDSYVYDPDKSTGETVLQATRGAFRFVTGRLKELKQNKIAVSTPVADIGIRGTEFWGGPIDAKYGILLLDWRSDRLQPSRQRDTYTGARHRHPLAARCSRRAESVGRGEDCAGDRVRRAALMSESAMTINDRGEQQ